VELADTSAWTSRHRNPLVAVDFDERVLAGEIATCPIVVLELLWTAQNPPDLAQLREELAALPRVEITPAAWDRAFEVWQHLAEQGRHRQVSRVDLVVAAAAELAGMPVCHYDADFGTIAAVTGQAERPIAPLGSL
jgi:predicted nucleic acid-binding protein